MGAEVKSMDVKKDHQSTVNAQAWTAKRFQNFVTDLRGEVQKITWTNRDELIVYTKIVVAAAFVFGMSIYSLDLIIQGVLSGLAYVLHLFGR